MKAAVTGASGHLGSALLEALAQAGHEVRAVLRPGDAAPHVRRGPAQVVEADVRDAPALRRAVEGVEVIFHLAVVLRLAPDRDGQMQAVNVGGTRNVLDAAEAAGVRRVVHCSSHHALERFPLDQPLHEGRPLALRDPCDYHRTKAEAEALALARARGGLDVVIASPGTMVGPHDHGPSLFGQTLLDIHHRRLPVMAAAVSDYVDVRDVCAGMLAAADRGRRGERYLLGGEVLDARALGAAVRAATGRPVPRVILPLWLLGALVPIAGLHARLTGQEPRLTAEVVRACMSSREVRHDKATRELGYTRRPFAETLRDTFAWFERQGWLEARPGG